MNIFITGYENCRKYLENADLVVFIILTIIVLYFLLYLVSFFFKLPVIILTGALIGYYLYKDNNKKIKII